MRTGNVKWMWTTLGVAAAAAAIYLLRFNSGPKNLIEWSSELADLGRTKPGVKTQIIFHARNSTSHKVNIEEAHADCPCVAVAPSSRQVLPRENFTISAAFDSTGLSQTVERGIIVKLVSETGEIYAKRLRVRALVTVGYRLNARMVDFGVVTPGETVVRELSIIRDPGSENTGLYFSGIDGLAAELTAFTPYLQSDKASLRLTYTPPENAREGTVAKSVAVVTSEGNRLAFDMSATIFSPLKVDSSSMELVGTGVQLINVLDRNAQKITAVTSDPDRYVAHVEGEKISVHLADGKLTKAGKVEFLTIVASGEGREKRAIVPIYERAAR